MTPCLYSSYVSIRDSLPPFGGPVLYVGALRSVPIPLPIVTPNLPHVQVWRPRRVFGHTLETVQ